jgi:tRNA(His) 5'-end guanylyltransferase
LEKSVEVNRLIQVSPKIGKIEKFFTDTSTSTFKQIDKYSQQRAYLNWRFREAWNPHLYETFFYKLYGLRGNKNNVSEGDRKITVPI